jgi:hypothetical protein
VLGQLTDPVIRDQFILVIFYVVQDLREFEEVARLLERVEKVAIDELVVLYRTNPAEEIKSWEPVAVHVHDDRTFSVLDSCVDGIGPAVKPVSAWDVYVPKAVYFFITVNQ